MNDGGINHTPFEKRARVYLGTFKDELLRAIKKHPGDMHSIHEGYAVLLEELDEVWDAIKTKDIAEARREMVQVGAMALRFLIDTEGK